jgi:hypothetical protein
VSDTAAKRSEVKKVEPKKVFKVTLIVNGSNSTILRPGLPTIFDSTIKAVAWIKENGFEAKDINIVGDKPGYWETYYPSPVVESVLVEKLAEVLEAPSTEKTATVPESVPETITVTTVNLSQGTVVQEQVKDVFEGIPVTPVS